MSSYTAPEIAPLTAAAVTRAINAECDALHAFDTRDDVLAIVPDDNNAFNPAGRYTPEQCAAINTARAEMAKLLHAATRTLQSARHEVKCKKPEHGLAFVRRATELREQAAQIVTDAVATLAPVAPCQPAPARDLPISAGARVEVTFGPDTGQLGTVYRALDYTGYIAVTLDRAPEGDAWGSLFFYLPEEIRPSTVPPPEERPWANDGAYSALG
jgi:hypothetical protein